MSDSKFSIKDFKRHSFKGGGLAHYFSHNTKDGYLICLESCLSGYCVAIYERHSNDREWELVNTETCTNLPEFIELSFVPGIPSGAEQMLGALRKAMSIADDKLKEVRLDKNN